VKKEKHIRPIVYSDKELLYMRDDLSEGVVSFKSDLNRMLNHLEVRVIPHEEIFAKLEEASRHFNVLVVKTDNLMPYTSVFMELDCGYWSEDKEKILRSRIS
jgi:predicted nucleic acid-binding protein